MTVNAARGMRDFLPADVRRRRQLQRTIESVFESFGFEPLETPAAERIETLMGKYGEEGDQLLFKILKRGEGAERGEVDMGLRYDLTVPLARVMAMFGHHLPLPFKRYQIQPVWRADRPQKGRFREFVQCDIDVVGTDSLAADAELVVIAHEALSALGLGDYRMRVNHRAALRALAHSIGASSELEGDFLTALDKLDKVGAEGVLAELEQRGFSAPVVAQARDMLRDVGGALDGLEFLVDRITGKPDGKVAVDQLRELVSRLNDHDLPSGRWAVDPTLARGLSYYTGPVFEAELEGFSGSVAGGGRYDGLIGMFSGRAVPATGLSLGFERLLVVLEQRGRLASVHSAADVMVLALSEAERGACQTLAAALRQSGLRVIVPPDVRKVAKQLKSASTQSVPLVVIVGADEVQQRIAQLKRLDTGEQKTVQWEALPAEARNMLPIAITP